MSKPRSKSQARRTAIQQAQDRAREVNSKRTAAQKKESQDNSATRAKAGAPKSSIPFKDPRDAAFEQKARDEGWDTPESIAFYANKYRLQAEKKAATDAAPGNQMLDAAKKVTDNAQRLRAEQAAAQEQAASQSSPLADPNIYGQAAADRLRAARDATEKARLLRLQKSGQDLIYLGSVKAPATRPRYGQAGDFAQTQSEAGQAGGREIGDSIAGSTTLMGWLYDDAHRKMILNQAKKAGLELDPNDFDTLEKIWTTVLKRSAVAFQAGQKVTPWAIMGLMAKQGAGKATSRTTTETTIEDVDPSHARSLITQAAKQMLGQDPTPAQIDDFIARAQLAAKQHPQVRKTTTQYDAAGNAVSSTSHVSGGLTDDALQQQAQDMAEADPTYAEYQAVGTYMPALFDLVNSTVG